MLAIVNGLDQIYLFYRLEQTMNNIDSNSGEPFEVLPINPASAPQPASRKAAALKARLARILSASGTKTAEHQDMPSHFTFGVKRIDAALRGNAAEQGLPRAALHELHAADKGDKASTAAMALLLAQRCRALGSDNKPILWISESGEARRQGRLYPPGLAEMGLDPSHIIHVDAPDSIAVLRAAADGVRCAAMGAVIAELSGKKPKGLDLTATRRLSLSAQQSGVVTWLLRNGSDKEDPLPTSAFSRWEICAAPSIPLEANAPGQSAFDITLLRHRSGLYGLNARLEWNCDHHEFREQDIAKTPPNFGAVSPLPAVRTNHQGARAA